MRFLSFRSPPAIGPEEAPQAGCPAPGELLWSYDKGEEPGREAAPWSQGEVMTWRPGGGLAEAWCPTVSQTQTLREPPPHSTSKKAWGGMEEETGSAYL